MKRYLDLFKQTFREFGDDKAPRLGAALAYYTIFSIAPLLLIAIAIAGLAFGKSNAQQQIVAQLHQVLGPSAGDAISDMLKNAAKPKSGVIATVLGVLTLLLGASGVFAQLKDALNTIWNVAPKKKGGILATIKGRFLSFSMVFGVGFLLLVSLVLDAAIKAGGKYLGNRLPGGEAPWDVLQVVVSFGVVTVLFALMFRFLPDVKIEWRDVWFGAAFTSFLFVLGKFGLGLYLGRSAVGSSYGAAGSLVILLVWVYYSAQILFFGAEFTQVYARTHGSLRGEAGATQTEKSQVRPEDRTKAEDAEPRRPAVPAPAYPARPATSGGGAAKLAAGGVAGLVLGTLVGGVAAIIVTVKSVKKLFT